MISGAVLSGMSCRCRRQVPGRVRAVRTRRALVLRLCPTLSSQAAAATAAIGQRHLAPEMSSTYKWCITRAVLNALGEFIAGIRRKGPASDKNRDELYAIIRTYMLTRPKSMCVPLMLD